MKIDDKQVQAVIRLPAPKRYEHFVKMVADTQKAWGLYKDGWALAATDAGTPVFLVIGNSEGEVRWMEIRDYLKRESNNGKNRMKQIVFTGERFDVMSVRRWREKLLADAS